MIDTKIACQCGNRFKFGMDLVNGRAPDGLICPTCGAPATAACNLLVEFLSGKEPAPPAAGSRPMKEIKVTCACGARYKFDLELAEQVMPSVVVCPGCQADLTALANEEIRGYRAKHAISPTVTTATEPASASPPAVTPSPVTPTAATPASPPPTPSPVADTSPAAPAAPATPAAPAVTPVTDPFGTAPKSSGPNLPPLDPSKFQSSRPPAKKPLPGADKPAAAPPTSPAKSEKSEPGKSPAKPADKPTAKSAAPLGEPNVVLGVVGAVAGALIGAVIWFMILKFTTPSEAKLPPPPAATSVTTMAFQPPPPLPTAGWMALVVGGLAGLGARLLGRSSTPVLGGAACISTFVATVFMVWLALGRHVDAKFAPQLATQYKAAVDRAQAALNTKTDAELRPFVLQTMPIADMDTARVSDDALKTYREVEFPKLRAFLADKDSRAKFEARLRGQYRSSYGLDEAWDEAFGMLGLLWIVAAVLGAAKLGMK